MHRELGIPLFRPHIPPQPLTCRAQGGARPPSVLSSQRASAQTGATGGKGLHLPMATPGLGWALPSQHTRPALDLLPKHTSSPLALLPKCPSSPLALSAHTRLLWGFSQSSPNLAKPEIPAVPARRLCAKANLIPTSVHVPRDTHSATPWAPGLHGCVWELPGNGRI